MMVEINRSKKGPYYEMTVDNKFAGNYDTVKEAADDFEEMKAKAGKDNHEQSA